MKLVFLLVIGLTGQTCLSQTKTKPNFQQAQKSDSVNFVAIVDIHNATKDGIYINGYVVNIDYAKAKSINGKKVRISGKVTVVKGTQTNPVAQGRTKDTKHIENPLIQVLNK